MLEAINYEIGVAGLRWEIGKTSPGSQQLRAAKYEAAILIATNSTTSVDGVLVLVNWG